MAVRWGICSTGDVSQVFTHCLNTLSKQENKVLAACARDLGRAQAFAKRFNAERAYGSYQELADDKDVDIVYIGTLHTEHHRLCLMFLEAGKHVLCEKPCTMNLKQLTEVIEKAKDKDVFFMEALWTRFLPVYDVLRKELKDKTIGEARLVNVILSNSFGDSPRRTLLEWGGGGLIDLGVYGIQLVCHIFNEKPEKVLATGHRLHTGVDQMTSLTLEFSRDRMAHITVSITTANYHKAVVIGTDGQIEIPGYQWCPTEIVTPSGKHTFPLDWNPVNDLPVPLGYTFEAEQVSKCVREGRRECPLMPLSDSLMIKEILDEARRQLGVRYKWDED